MGSKSGDRITGTCLVDNIIAIGAGALTGTHVSGIAIAGSTNALRGQSWSGIRFYTAMTISLRPALPRYVSTAGIYIRGQPTRLTFISTSSSSWALGLGVDLSSEPVSFIQTSSPYT
jgi:hypothetical protein